MTTNTRGSPHIYIDSEGRIYNRQTGTVIGRTAQTGKAEHTVVFGGVPRLPDDAFAYTRTEDDARLIAAAPALLEALRALLAFVESLHEVGYTVDFHYPQAIDDFDKARAAIRMIEKED